MRQHNSRKQASWNATIKLKGNSDISDLLGEGVDKKIDGVKDLT